MRYPESYPEIMSRLFKVLIVVDVETTGFDAWRNEIITWSMSAVDYFTLERLGSIELTFQPKNLQYWGKGAEDVHGISVSQALYFEDRKISTNRAIEFIEDYCKGKPNIMVCHAFDKYKTCNLFDINMIKTQFILEGKRDRFYRNCRYYQSTETYFRAARSRGYYRAGGGDLFSQVNEGEEGSDFKLKTLCKHYKIKLDKHHTAQDDREACEELYRIARGLGTNEDESTFDLQGSDDIKGIRSGEDNTYGLRHNHGYGESTYKEDLATETIPLYESDNE
jgi:DNA polymerase III epsilon subunit-like protein